MVQIAPQLGDPPAGFGIDLLIDLNRTVLLEGERFQRPLVPVHPEGHLRVAHQIAVVDIGVTDRKLVRAGPLQMQGHHALPGLQVQIAVLAADHLGGQLRQSAVIQLRPGPSGLFRDGRGICGRNRFGQFCSQFCDQVFNRVPVSSRKAKCDFAVLMVEPGGADPGVRHEPFQQRRFLRSHRCVVVGDGDFGIIGPIREGAHGVGLSVNGNNRHIMAGPQLFHILIQRMGGEAAHIHPSHAADRPGEGQPQQGGGGLGVLAVQLKEISHLVQEDAVRVGLPDLIQFIPPWSAGTLLLRLGRGGLSRWCGRFGGGWLLLYRDWHREKVKGHLPIVILRCLGLHLLPQGTGRSSQLALRLLRDLPLGLEDTLRLFDLLGLPFGLPGLSRRLFRLTLGLQGRLRQRREQGVFAPSERLHIP